MSIPVKPKIETWILKDLCWQVSEPAGYLCGPAPMLSLRGPSGGGDGLQVVRVSFGAMENV